jgi:hypothetical protein
MIMQWDIIFLTYLGYLGRHETDRIISICVASPKVVKVSKEGNVISIDIERQK